MVLRVVTQSTRTLYRRWREIKNLLGGHPNKKKKSNMDLRTLYPVLVSTAQRFDSQTYWYVQMGRVDTGG
jgi:hypothetical protein